MKTPFRAVLTAGTVVGMWLASVPASANLIVNGGFEDPSGGYSSTVTPPGWTNIGHSDGVIPYSQFATPAYEGNYYYDLGGFGNSGGPIGDGISQTVATVVGTEYELFFGLSSEDVSGGSTLTVDIDGFLTVFPLTSTGTFLGKGFTTQNILYTATSSSTTISFIETENPSGGNNDPMIDCVAFDVRGSAGGCGSTSSVPEPASLALLGVALAGFGFSRRRKLH